MDRAASKIKGVVDKLTKQEIKNFVSGEYNIHITHHLSEEIIGLIKTPLKLLGCTFIALNIMFILIIILYTLHLLTPSWHWLTEGQIKLIQVLIYSILPSNEYMLIPAFAGIITAAE